MKSSVSHIYYLSRDTAMKDAKEVPFCIERMCTDNHADRDTVDSMTNIWGKKKVGKQSHSARQQDTSGHALTWSHTCSPASRAAP